MNIEHIADRLGLALSWSDWIPVLLVAVVLWGIRKKLMGQSSEGPISRRQGLALRGFFACVVMLSHIVAATLNSGGGALVYRFSTWGRLSVAVFFGLSGYGLAFQARSNARYVDDFWKHRLRTLGWPYLILSLLSVGQILRGDVVLSVRLRYQLGSLIATGWFIHVLLLFYLTFWWCMRKHKDDVAGGIVWTCCLVLTESILVTCLGLESGEEYGAFAFGLLLGTFPENAIRWLERYLVPLLLFAGAIAVMHLVWQPYLKYIVPSRQSLTRFLMYSFFFLGIAASGVKVQLGNRVLAWLGMISYELYLCHVWVMTEVRHWWPTAGKDGSGTGDGFVYVVVVGSLALATALHWLVEHIKRIQWSGSSPERG